jgi:type VI secretion system secreted protein VgrG
MPIHQVQITVKIGGSNISPISYCTVRQRTDWHHEFDVCYVVDFFTEKYNTILGKIKDFIGKEIEITFTNIKNDQKEVLNRFFGIVTEAGVSRTTSGNKEIRIHGYSPTFLIDGRQNTRSFAEKSLNDIVQSMHDQIPQNDLKIKCNPSFRGEIPYIVQYNESNFHFLNRIADKYGEWCFYDGSELVFGKLDKSKAIELVVDNTLLGFDFSFNLKNLNYKALAYDYLENTVYQKETKDFAVNDLDPQGDHVFKQSEKIFKQNYTVYAKDNFAKENDFKDFYEARKFAETRKLICSEGSSNNPSIKAGSVIRIKSLNDQEDDFGEFIITSVDHSFDATGKYSNQFQAIPKQNINPPVNQHIIAPVCDLQPAVVTDNDDPEKLGRVKVRFFWQTSQDSTPWLRLIHAHGGKTDQGEQHGFYFIPELNDEVMVGFEGNNPDKPFVTGNLYHKNSKPDHWYHGDNNIKSIRTRSGNQIILNDEDGKEEIRILHKDDGSPTNEISLSMNDKGKITIKTEGELEISADRIKISAQSEISIDSGKGTKLSVNDFRLEANNAINIKGQQLEIQGTNTSMKGSAQLELEGSQSELKGNLVKINGSGQTELSGAMVKVAGSGITEITGGIVKIN